MSVTRAYKYHILTFGCQMNKSDSERLETILQKMGLILAVQKEDADLIIMNSCSVRDSAESRIMGQVRDFAKLKEKNPDLIVAVTGCMPGRDKEGKLAKKMPIVDLYFPIKDMIYLSKWLSGLNYNFTSGIEPVADYLSLRPAYEKKYQAYVPIQTGCTEYCSYCVVPYARGERKNRSAKEILGEVFELARRGCQEITLLGQIVNNYVAPDPEQFSLHNPYKKNDFAKLLWEINNMEGIARIFWTAPHPSYMDAEVIDALTLSRQINYIHLPVQSGNNEVLKRMNRRYTREYYIETVDKIRAKRPEIAIGTDIIVGFPDETEAEFADTVSLYKRCDFDISFHAKYSERSGTLAAKRLEDNVPQEVKKERWFVLQNLMENITAQKNQKYIGQKVNVLVDKYSGDWCEGNSGEMKRVRYKGLESDIGTMQNVEIFKADTWMMWGNK